MSDSNDNLSMCDEMWNRVKTIYELNRQLKEFDLWLNNHSKLNKSLSVRYKEIEGALTHVYHLMVELQVHLLIML